MTKCNNLEKIPIDVQFQNYMNIFKRAAYTVHVTDTRCVLIHICVIYQFCRVNKQSCIT